MQEEARDTTSNLTGVQKGNASLDCPGQQSTRHRRREENKCSDWLWGLPSAKTQRKEPTCPFDGAGRVKVMS
jgi:hypothetical protein